MEKAERTPCSSINGGSGRDVPLKDKFAEKDLVKLSLGALSFPSLLARDLRRKGSLPRLLDF